MERSKWHRRPKKICQFPLAWGESSPLTYPKSYPKSLETMVGSSKEEWSGLALSSPTELFSEPSLPGTMVGGHNWYCYPTLREGICCCLWVCSLAVETVQLSCKLSNKEVHWERITTLVQQCKETWIQHPIFPVSQVPGNVVYCHIDLPWQMLGKAHSLKFQPVDVVSFLLWAPATTCLFSLLESTPSDIGSICFYCDLWALNPEVVFPFHTA